MYNIQTPIRNNIGNLEKVTDAAPTCCHNNIISVKCNVMWQGTLLIIVVRIVIDHIDHGLYNCTN